MPNWCVNELTISGPTEEIKRFLDGLKREDDRYHLIESCFPIPQELIEMDSPAHHDIGYDVFFNPDPEGYLWVLKLPEIKKHGIETREQLMDYLKKEHPKCYEKGLGVNENLLKYGYKNRYWWCVENWGTKWADSNTTLAKQEPTCLVFGYNTAWSPAMEAFNYIASLFPKLVFRIEFGDELCTFRGYAQWKCGTLTDYDRKEVDAEECLTEGLNSEHEPMLIQRGYLERLITYTLAFGIAELVKQYQEHGTYDLPYGIRLAIKMIDEANKDDWRDPRDIFDEAGGMAADILGIPVQEINPLLAEAKIPYRPVDEHTSEVGEHDGENRFDEERCKTCQLYPRCTELIEKGFTLSDINIICDIENTREMVGQFEKASEENENQSLTEGQMT